MGTVYNLWLTMQEPTQKSEHFETVGGTIGLVLYNKKQIWQKQGKSVYLFQDIIIILTSSSRANG